MKPLVENVVRFLQVTEKVKGAPLNQKTQEIKRRLSDIRDLMIKADVLMDTGKNPSYIFDQIEQLLDSIDEIPNKEK